jgi:hypothetical protein
VPEDAVRLRAPVEHLDAISEPLRALYRFADGQEGSHGLFDHHHFLTAADARDEKLSMDQLARDEGWPETWWSERWHPFASDGAGQLLVVDADEGAVLEFLHDDDARPILARSLDAFLARFVESLDAGERVWDEEMGIVEVAARAEHRAARARADEQDAKSKKLSRALLAAMVVGSVALTACLILLDAWLRG